MYKKIVMHLQICCFANQTYCFLPFSLPSASSLLKLPIYLTDVSRMFRIEASKATGSDGIPARISKIAAPHISLQVVTHLFNESFNQGIYPTSWKTAVLRMKTTIGLSQPCPASRKSKSLSWIEFISTSLSSSKTFLLQLHSSEQSIHGN